jgi:hypothetical protein
MSSPPLFVFPTALASSRAAGCRKHHEEAEAEAEAAFSGAIRPTPALANHAQMVADLVGELHAAGLKKQTIRKTVSVLAMVLDHGRGQVEGKPRGKGT